MTAIAAVVEDGRVWIGGDSAGVASYSLATRRDPKVFVVGGFVFGYTSSFRMGQILRHYFSEPAVNEGQELFDYMVTSFVPHIRKLFKDHGFMSVDSSVETAGTFLVGWRGHLFQVDSDLQVADHLHDFHACGCGQDLVLGSLHTTQHYRFSPKERIIMALEAAEEFSAGVRRPFIVESA